MKIGFFGLREQDKRDYFINSLSEHQIFFIDQDLTEENLPDKTDFEVISVFVQSKLNQKVLDHFENLKLIVIRATGFDNIDLKHAQSKGILVANVPAYGSHTVAEFAFGLILSLSRKIPQAVESVKHQAKFNQDGLIGFDLYGKTLGVIGTGKIGANVIKIAKGFGMIVQAYDLYPNQQLSQTLEFQYVPLDQLLKESDIITIHVPASLETHHLINSQNIYQLKKGAILINTARGDIVETEALYKAIMDGHLGGVGLDVVEGEGVLFKHVKTAPENNDMTETLSLIKSSNVIVTPHIAFYTFEAEEAIVQTTVENIQGFISGTPKNLVTTN